MEKSKRLTDEEILERWYPEHNFKGGRKFCTAAREFLELAGQWPWEWCVHDLNPRRWRPALVQDLGRLAETYKKSGKNLDEAKWLLIRAMRRRKTTDKKNQFLDQRDVNKVINEFKPQHPSPSNGTTEGERRQSNTVNKTRHEPTAVAKPTTSKSTSQPGSSRGSRVTTGLPDRSASRARMATSTHPVETELGPFVSSPMSEEEPESEPVPETTDRLETTRSSSPTLRPKKRARSSIWDLKAQLQHKPAGHTPDGISATLSEMRYHEITLQKRLGLRLEEKAAFEDPTRAYIEQQALSSLESKTQCLRSSIQTLERDRVPIKERIKEWEKLRSVMRYPDTAKMRGLDEVNKQLQKNTTAISNAKKTLQQTIEALDRQKAAGEKLAATVEDNLNEIGDQVMAWDALMRLVHGFPGSVHKVNEVLKLQDRCLEEIASFYGEPEDAADDDSGIDEPLIKTPELLDLPGWDPLDGSSSLAKAPLHDDI